MVYLNERLKSMSLKQLKNLAVRKKIPHAVKMKREHLIEALSVYS